MASDIYLGVRGVAATADGVERTAEDDPRAIEFVVEMRRYDEDHTLAARLDRGQLERQDMVTVARVLARFHSRARRVPAGDAPVLTVERRFEQNLHELLSCVERRGELDRVLALERFTQAFIAAHAQTFRAHEPRARARGTWGSPCRARARQWGCADRRVRRL